MANGFNFDVEIMAESPLFTVTNIGYDKFLIQVNISEVGVFTKVIEGFQNLVDDMELCLVDPGVYTDKVMNPDENDEENPDNLD